MEPKRSTRQGCRAVKRAYAERRNERTNVRESEEERQKQRGGTEHESTPR